MEVRWLYLGNGLPTLTFFQLSFTLSWILMAVPSTKIRQSSAQTLSSTFLLFVRPRCILVLQEVACDIVFHQHVIHATRHTPLIP